MIVNNLVAEISLTLYKHIVFILNCIEDYEFSFH